MKLKLFSIFLFIGFQILSSQEKFEKEYKIKENDAPQKATHIIKTWNLPKKIKWYAEESNLGKTFEAKTCFRKNKYSIEFSKDGNILDVEKTVKLKELPLEIQQKITTALKNRFTKYRIKKIQTQYVGSENAIYKEIFQLKPHQEKPIINYEIVVKGKTDKTYQSFEILLNTKGTIEKELKIKSGLSLNLEF